MTTTEAGKDTRAAAIAEQDAPAAPAKATAKKGASRKKEAPKAAKSAPHATPAAKAKAVSKAAARSTRASTRIRAETKGAKILEMIGRPKGATLAELMKATGWQAHSVRGFISNAGRKNGLGVESSKNEAGERTYNIAK